MSKPSTNISLLYLSQFDTLKSVLQCLSESHVNAEVCDVSHWWDAGSGQQIPDVVFIDSQYYNQNKLAQSQLQELLNGLPGRAGLAIVTETKPGLCALLEPAFQHVMEWQDNGVVSPVLVDVLQHLAANDVAKHLTRVSNDEHLRHNLIGASPLFRQVLFRLRKLARYDAPVLIRGETGTGKEGVARAIHYCGERRHYPFIPVDCKSIPENLIENELFGHESGAYAEARQSQSGLVAQAEGGTLFLDHIDALPSKTQVVLLRFLQAREYHVLGSLQSHKANMRVITATHADLTRLVVDESFRQDLLFCIDILSLDLPPLRERTGDIALLVDFFLDKYSRHYQQSPKFFDDQSQQWIFQQDWPGNVRELENFVHREFLLAEKTIIHLEVQLSESRGGRRTLPDRRQDMSMDLSFREAKSRIVRQFEEEYLRQLLRKSAGNVTEAARLAGKERRALGKLLTKYGINKNEFSC